ncbi:MAG: GNAT family N-acetyltransferase [Bacillota bacterium]
MIKKMDLSDRNIAREILSIQIPSYKVEAEIIGYFDIPPLKDTVDTLQQSGETFFGYYNKVDLCGAVSIKVEGDEMDIHRLIVHPSHFRKGIAQALLTFLEKTFDVKAIKVATGSKNNPAVTLYKMNGFQICNEVTINEQLSLTLFEKKTGRT